MDKKKLELVIAGILIVVFVVMLANAFAKVRQKAARVPAVQRPDDGAASPLSRLVAIRTKETKRAAVARTIPWGRDPFVLEESGPVQASAIGSLRLMGITVGQKNGKPHAIINDEIVSVGSRIGAFTVVNILPTKVVVTDGEKEYDLGIN